MSRIAATCLALAALVSASAHAAGLWPYKDSARKQHAGKTLQTPLEHAVHPLGNRLRVVKPVGDKRPMPKTILAKRPP